MESFLAVVNFLLANGPLILSALVGVCVALIGLFMLVPGEQPEKFLQSIVDFLAKFSIKPPVK